MIMPPTYNKKTVASPLVSCGAATCTSSVPVSVSVSSEKEIGNSHITSPQHLRSDDDDDFATGTYVTCDKLCHNDSYGIPKENANNTNELKTIIRKRRRNGGRNRYRNRNRRRLETVVAVPTRMKFSCQGQSCHFNRSIIPSMAVVLLVAILSQGTIHAFTSSFTFSHPIIHQHSHNHKTVVRVQTPALFARPSAKRSSGSSSTSTKTKPRSKEEETLVQAVQPLQSSTKEKRQSVQRAWEKAQLLNDASLSPSSIDFDESSLSATPFLDLFTDAGIASVKKMPTSSSSNTNKSQNIKPRNRPSSVPGAMSRQTMMTINEMQTRSRSISNSYNNNNNNNNGRSVNVNVNVNNGHGLDGTNLVDPFYTSRNFNTASANSNVSPSRRILDQQQLDVGATTRNGKNGSSSLSSKTSHSSILKGISKKAKKKAARGRGRPRKDKGNNASIDEITSIAAEATSSSSSTSSKMNSKSKKSSSSSSKSNSTSNNTPSMISSKADYEMAEQRGSSETTKSSTGSPTNEEKGSIETTTKRRSRRGELRTLRTKPSKKLKESEREGGTTGMMMQGNGKGSPNGVGGGKGGKEGEPPNLQRYYRTELLTPQEEYTLGMKIQFMINCEQVHEGLYEKFGRTPTIEEWAYACGFKEEESSPQNMQSDYVNQIRPIKNDGFDPVEDANMFVGNGLVNASGPGRGRGRAKKRPPSKLVDYYDDSDIKFEPDFKIKAKSLKPINRGTPMQFVNLMVRSKEAKQRMVQCNMRLVVSISKRYKHVGVNIADLVQEGSIGLTRAAEKFDPKKGFKFSTYASWWIQQAVFRSIAYHSRTIRLPVHVHNLLNRTRRVRLELQRILGRAPTNEEMATELGMTIEKYNKMIRLTRKAISLDMAKYQNNPKDIGQESETSLGDTIDASEVIRDENSPEQSVDRVLFRDDLKEMLQILGDDERAVIYSRYGIEDGLTRTVTTVAAQMGQSKSWVRSQECRALRKLRRPWYEKRLWEHQNSLTG